jgi:hypothetical protein
MDFMRDVRIRRYEYGQGELRTEPLGILFGTTQHAIERDSLIFDIKIPDLEAEKQLFIVIVKYPFLFILNFFLGSL